jgi:hypothetical protein
MALPTEKAAEKINVAKENNKYQATVAKNTWFLDLFYCFSPKMATNFIGKMMAKMKM